MESRERFAVDAPADEAWRRLGAFHALPEIAPLYVKSQMEGRGRFRRLSDRAGGELFEALLHFDHAARTFTYRILETKNIDLPYVEGSYTGTLRVIDDGSEKGCVLEVIARYEPKPGRAEEAARDTRAFYESCLSALARPRAGA